MNTEEVKARVLSLPEVAAWPEMSNLYERSLLQPHQIIEWPYRACKAVGGDESLAVQSAAAILCMSISITLVDDMLDKDSRGMHLPLGDAVTANLSFAFQAAAFRLICDTPTDGERRASVVADFADMGIAIAYGQHLDTLNLSGEDNYWKVTRAKTSSYYATAMHTGAILGDASPEVANQLRTLGTLIGEVVQIKDDISDALETPANPDWKEMRNNLLFLYAQTANHSDRERFLTLRSKVANPQALREAQQILIRCGAASYGLYQICERFTACKKNLEHSHLMDPTPLQELISEYKSILLKMLKGLRIRIPPEIETA